MRNHFCKMPLWEASKTLVDVAEGRKPAETVIRGARLVNVCTHEIQENIDVAIACGRIAMVGDCAHCIGEGTRVIDAAGQYLAPGFLDGHIHIESSMLTVSSYAKAVIPHGTVGVYIDPHEICNVLGVEGVKCMADDARTARLKTMITFPSCVPAVEGFEDAGARITASEIRETMQWDDVVGLGEMMNYPGIVLNWDGPHDIVDETLKADKVVTGHYSVPETGRGLNAYIAAGVRCCHESTRAEDALAKMRLGMYAQVREGSGWRDLHEVIRAITEHTVDSRYACLISDDTHPDTLIDAGHLDHIVRRAIEEGVDPITAIQMVTINTAQCFRMEQELGSVAPGKCADLVLIDDLTACHVTKTWIDGDLLAEDGKLLVTLPHYTFPAWAKDTMHVSGTITPETFAISARGKDAATVRAIEVIPAHVATIERHVTLQAKNDRLEADVAQDVLKAFVFERHHATGKVGAGFVKGFGIHSGAMAQTVAHDAHNLLVVGTNDADMALAANTLIACGGGMCAVSGGKVTGLVELPVAGLMNEASAEETAQKVQALERAWKDIGCSMVSPFMTMALVPLACIPDLRLTDRGLVDCNTYQFVDLFVE
ncbi:MAG: adenine deaminase [Oscillospiraceae bacterium]|nr:adenine deaminase [Oscillospiraceae bacterium]